MATIALIGAGGKMGCRITDNMVKSDHTVHYVETGEAGVANLKKRGVNVTPQAEAVAKADVVVLAVPDVVIGKVSHSVTPQMKPGALLMTLDPAAPLDGQLCRRDDIGYFIAHPGQPSVLK